MTVEGLVDILNYMMDKGMCLPEDKVLVYEPEAEHWGHVRGAWFDTVLVEKETTIGTLYLSAKVPEDDCNKAPHHLGIVEP
jgi:hypothetical protein